MPGPSTGEALAIVSLVPPAVHAIRLLINDIENIRDAPSDVANVKTELGNFEGALATLKKSLEEDGEEEINLESMRDLRNGIKRGHSSTREYKELIATVLKYEGQRTRVKVRNVQIQDRSRAMVGVQNINEGEGGAQVDIDQVVVAGDSKAMVGVQNKVDFKGYWG